MSPACATNRLCRAMPRGPVCVLVALSIACGGPSRPKAGGDVTVEEPCRVVIPPAAGAEDGGASSSRAKAAAREDRPSRVIVVAEASLTDIARELETSIGRRLANVRGVGVGVAGKIDYTADRGPFSVSVDRNALVVRTDVHANAKVCKGRRCYASCKPQAVALARVPLTLQPNYRFGQVRVTAKITRGCKIKALGGFLTIDVTPNIERRLEPELRKIERRIAQRLPDVRAEAERGWRELDRPRELPLLGCLSPHPRGVIQGPIEEEQGLLRMRFALAAEPELRATCPEAAGPSRLPPLGRAAKLPGEGEVRLGLVSPFAEVAAALERSPLVDVGGAAAKVDRAKVGREGDGLGASLAVTGEICGDVSVFAVPRWSDDQRAIALSGAALHPSDASRAREVSIDPAALAKALTDQASVPVPVVLERVGEALEGLAKTASDESVDVTARVSRVRPVDAIVRKDDLVARVGVRGSVVLHVRRPR